MGAIVIRDTETFAPHTCATTNVTMSEDEVSSPFRVPGL